MAVVGHHRTGWVWEVKTKGKHRQVFLMLNIIYSMFYPLNVMFKHLVVVAL